MCCVGECFLMEKVNKKTELDLTSWFPAQYRVTCQNLQLVDCVLFWMVLWAGTHFSVKSHSSTHHISAVPNFFVQALYTRPVFTFGEYISLWHSVILRWVLYTQLRCEWAPSHVENSAAGETDLTELSTGFRNNWFVSELCTELTLLKYCVYLYTAGAQYTLCTLSLVLKLHWAHCTEQSFSQAEFSTKLGEDNWQKLFCF